MSEHGPRANGAKLTAEQVRFIRSARVPVAQLAAQFGVGRKAIYAVKAGTTHKGRQS